MKKMIMPPLVLTIIAAIVCGLLVFAYNLTYVDTTGQLTDEMKSSAQVIYPDGDFKLLTTEEDGKTVGLTFGNVKNVIKENKSGDIILEVIGSGYEADSLDVLVGFDADGKIKGVTYIACNDTKGIGTRTNDPDFLKKFADATKESEVKAVDGLSGATLSSNGLKSAINEAMKVYNEHKEDFIDE